FRELPFDPVQVQVDLPLVIAAEPDAENDVVDFLRGHRWPDRVAGQGGLHPVQEGVHLVDLVPTPKRASPEPLTLTRHCSAFPSRLRVPAAPSETAPARVVTVVEAASCPHAPSISRPRVSRTVVGTPAVRSLCTNSRSTAFGLASHREPGVGFNGMRLTCASLPASSLPRRSARHG